MTGQAINDIHYKRFQILIDYIRKNDKGEGVLLKRKDVLDIIGISEGDSAKAIFKIINDMPEVYQDVLRIKKENRWKRYYYIGTKLKEKGKTIVFKKVVPIGENRYLSTISAKQLGEWWDKQVIRYNPLIQRGEREVVLKDGTVIKEPIYNKTNVKKIAEKIAEGTYHTDTIVLNVLKTGEELFTYSNGTLTIQNADICILDGQHRLHAINMVKDLVESGEVTDIDLENLIFPIQIENMDIKEAQDAFSQFSKGLKISSTRAEYFNNKDVENILIKEVIRESVLKDKVETVRNNVLKSNKEKVVTFGTLINAFKLAFPKPEKEDEYKEVKSFLIQFFNKLFEIIPEFTDYEKRKESWKHSLIAENFAFYGYMYLASMLVGDSDWENKIDNLLNINFEKDSSIWYGKVTRKGKKGYNITNNSDTRNYFMKRLEKEFLKFV